MTDKTNAATTPAQAGTSTAPNPAAARDGSQAIEAKSEMQGGGRGRGVLLAVASAVVFAAVYAILAAIIIASTEPEQPVAEGFAQFLGDPSFYFPALLFVVGFVVMVLFVKRSGWRAHAIGSFLVAAFVYFGIIGIRLLVSEEAAPVSEQFLEYAADPYLIVAAIVAREVSLWVGSAISARGRRVDG